MPTKEKKGKRAPKKPTEIEEMSMQEKDKKALYEGVALKMRPIIDELDLWRKNSMSAAIRL